MAQSSVKKISALFIHHSTGTNLIREGNVRALLRARQPEIGFFDHSYNLAAVLPMLQARFSYKTGLTDADGKITGRDFDIVLSNDSPKEYAEIFARPAADPTLSQILQFDVIAFKNCYPTTKIVSEEQLQEVKALYLSIKKSVQKYPTQLFVLFTSPPLRAELTTLEYARRARELCNWLSSDEFSGDVKNLVVFDFFNLLASPKNSPQNANILKRKYARLIPFDGHPNKKANVEVAKVFVDFLAEKIKKITRFS